MRGYEVNIENDGVHIRVYCGVGRCKRSLKVVDGLLPDTRLVVCRKHGLQATVVQRSGIR